MVVLILFVRDLVNVNYKQTKLILRGLAKSCQLSNCNLQAQSDTEPMQYEWNGTIQLVLGPAKLPNSCLLHLHESNCTL